MKKEIDLTGRYGQIKYDVRDILGLSNNEYLGLEYIAKMQGRPSVNNPGYCDASPEYLAAIMGIAVRNYFAFCKRMENFGFAERHPKTRKMKVTLKVYDLICGTGDETSVTKTASDETSPEKQKPVTNHHQTGDETSVHNNIVNRTASFYNIDIMSGSENSQPQEQEKEKITPNSARPPKKEKVDYSQQIETVVSHLNFKSGSKFRANSKTTISHIAARLAQGYGVDDFALVVDFKCAAWLNDPKMSEYLRPETLFCEKHFEGYLNAAVKWHNAGQPAGAQMNRQNPAAETRSNNVKQNQHDVLSLINANRKY